MTGAANQDRNGPDGPMGQAERLTIYAGIGWVLLCGLLVWLAPGRIGITGALLPLVLLAVAFGQARQLRQIRADAARLRDMVDVLQEAAAAAPAAKGQPGSGGTAAPPTPQPSPAAAALAAQAARDSEAANADAGKEPPAVLFRSQALRMGHAGAPPARPPELPLADPAPTFATRRDGAGGTSAPRQDADGQSLLPLGPALDPPPPLPVADFTKALNFPETPEDTDGFRALRRALKHPDTGPLIQAAQDVLTLLSQVGLYMDDLVPDRARPELWRRFAEGDRGGAVVALGGVRDEAALALCATQMRSDPVFRDAAHHFLRRFDQMLTTQIDTLDDGALVTLAETRTARAFMVLGRVAGVFD